MRRSTLFASRTFLVLGLILTCARAGESQSLGGSTTPFELVSGFLVVVNGQVGEVGDLRFILDTGSTYTVIDQRVADKLHLVQRPGRVTNFDRDVPAAWAEVCELRAGPVQAAAARVLVVRLADYSEFARNIDGIIGLDLLSKGKRLMIDYEKRLVSFEAGGERTEARAAAKTLVVPIIVQGLRMRLLVDTGSREMLLYKGRLREKLTKVTSVGEVRPAVIGRMQAMHANLPGVRIAGPEEVASFFLIDEPERGAPAGVDGYLGPTSLNAKRIELDFAANKLRWQ